ncbi:hypothetical protein MTR67_005324 [Solanum verrucosum]|uniref:Uncharacterized protein n=1 Tax=Solanum verrucosum TaxID=315347 RepID=A0AAF0PVL0_SOLVR|nr:hypothetical protein MTR67_005324 [Solanum verrucosum]
MYRSKAAITKIFAFFSMLEFGDMHTSRKPSNKPWHKRSFGKSLIYIYCSLVVISLCKKKLCNLKNDHTSRGFWYKIWDFENLYKYEYDRGDRGNPKILWIVASVVERSVQKNEKALKGSNKRGAVTVFHGTRAPVLTVQQYIERIFKYSNCSPSCFVVA